MFFELNEMELLEIDGGYICACGGLNGQHFSTCRPPFIVRNVKKD